ncbi:lysylphosphatidylglycerol synthase transmembrane domain-containing protein [Jatrophihabitans sp. DSM 45814]
MSEGVPSEEALASAEAVPARHGLHPHHPLRWALVMATLAVAALILVPKVDEAKKALDQLGSASAGWIILAGVAEIASLIGFSLVTFALLPESGRPSLPRVFRLDLVTVALSHSVPAGSAAGTALGYGLLAEEGVGAVSASSAKVLQSIVSGVMLQIMLWLALGFAALGQSASPAYLAVSAAGGLMLVFLLGGLWVMVRHSHRTGHFAGRLFGGLPRMTPERVSNFVVRLCDRIRELVRRPWLTAWVCTWSLANWVFDLFALWASLRAFGVTPNFGEVTIAFCIAQVAGAIPISPGGLGLIEGSLVPLLASFGTDSSIAVLGVLMWRLFNFWLPLPVGLVAYLGIVADRRRGILPRKRPEDRGQRWAGATT